MERRKSGASKEQVVAVEEAAKIPLLSRFRWFSLRKPECVENFSPTVNRALIYQ
jgi:hypothetical protein